MYTTIQFLYVYIHTTMENKYLDNCIKRPTRTLTTIFISLFLNLGCLLLPTESSKLYL